jgi:hypothetical protein
VPLNSRGARVGRTASSDRNDEEMRQSADAMHQFLSGRGRRGSSHSGNDDDDDDDDSGAGGPLHTAAHCSALHCAGRMSAALSAPTATLI